MFKFKDPDTGREFEAKNKPDLIKQIVAYREQNEFPPITELAFVIDNYLCSLPENEGACTEVPLRYGWYQYLRGGIALVEYLFYGEKNLVPPARALERAKICVKCPFNTFPKRSELVKWANTQAEIATGGRTTVVDAKLGTCGVCGCPLRAKVHYGGKVKPSEKELAKYPDFCWQKTEALDDAENE